MVDKRFFASVASLQLSALLKIAGADTTFLSSEQAVLLIAGAGPLETAQSDQISLGAHKSYSPQISSTKAGAVIVSNALADLVPPSSIAIVCDNPHLMFVAMLEHLFPYSQHYLASQPNLPELGKPIFEANVCLGENAVVGSGAQIGENSILGPNCVVGPGVTIGRDTVIGANSTIECALLGDRVIIGDGARIGVEGFGWLDHGKSNKKIPQLGRAILQSDVEVGANTTIDRGALGDTLIGEGTKIGAMSEIGHNSQIGRYCLLAPMVGLAGGTVLADSVLMGANAASAGHLKIGAGSIVHARSAVSKDWPPGSMLAGTPAQNIKDFWREQAAIRKLAKGKNSE